MRSHVHAFTCASCGGMLASDDREVTITCPWCVTGNRLAGDDLPRTYWIGPVLDGGQAVREVRKATSRSPVAGGFESDLMVSSRDLVFVPFNALRAIRTGRMVLKQRTRSGYGGPRSSRLDDFSLMAGFDSGFVSGLVTTEGETTRYTTDTRIVLAETVLAEPACEASDLGVGGIAFERNVFGRNGQPLMPYSREKMSASGAVLEPERHPRKLRARLDDMGKSTPTVQDRRRIETVGVQLFQVYYPVWILRCTFHGRGHRFVVDAVDGSVIAGRVPAGRFHRALVGTAGVFLAATPLALSLRAAIGLAGHGPGLSFFTGDPALVGMLGSAVFLAAGWGFMIMGWVVGSFRRSNELVFRAGALVADVVELPGRGTVERMGIAILSRWERMIGGASRSRTHGR